MGRLSHLGSILARGLKIWFGVTLVMGAFAMGSLPSAEAQTCTPSVRVQNKVLARNANEVTAIRVDLEATASIQGGDAITQIRFLGATNAAIDLNGIRMAVPSTQIVNPPLSTLSFVVSKQTMGSSFMVQYEVTDRCGSVLRFEGAGGGTGTVAATSTATSQPGATPLPTRTPTSVPATATSQPPAATSTPRRSTSTPTSTSTAAPSTPTTQPTLAPTSTPASTSTPLPTSAPSPSPTGTSGNVALGVYRPELPNQMNAVLNYEQGSGQHISVIHWFALWDGWKRDFSLSDLEAVSARGSVPLVSWEPWSGTPNDPNWKLSTAILSGAHDDYIRSWAQGMAAYGRPVFLRFAHEMHNSPYPWAIGVNGNTSADYVAAWRHVRAIFAQYNTSNVRWVWNPNTMGASPATTYLPIYQSLYPGDAEVDWVGLDIYNTGPVIDWGAPYWRSFSEILSPPYQAITTISTKPLILPEVGSTEIGGSKAAWTSEGLGPTLVSQFPRVKALVWFDVNKETDWRIASSSSMTSAFLSTASLSQFHISLMSFFGF